MTKTKGFTLMELIIVIVIMGILASVAVPKYMTLRRASVASVLTSTAAALQATLASEIGNRSALGITPIFPTNKNLADAFLSSTQTGTTKIEDDNKGINVTVSGNTYLIPTYKTDDCATANQTKQGGDTVRCIGAAPTVGEL